MLAPFLKHRKVLIEEISIHNEISIEVQSKSEPLSVSYFVAQADFTQWTIIENEFFFGIKLIFFVFL